MCFLLLRAIDHSAFLANMLLRSGMHIFFSDACILSIEPCTHTSYNLAPGLLYGTATEGNQAHITKDISRTVHGTPSTCLKCRSDMTHTKMLAMCCSGSIPAAWSSANLISDTLLRRLNLGGNRLTGELPRELIGGPNSTQYLGDIKLNDNQFSGKVSS